jgi:lipopolysaccharide export LptBFGC system permease protein LptF
MWQLGRAPIRAARHSAGLPQRSMLVPVLAGVAMVMVLAVFLVTMRIGTTANNAKILAEQKVGPGYRFHISSLRSSQGDNGKSVVGVVIAWKEDDIQRIPVHWLE